MQLCFMKWVHILLMTEDIICLQDDTNEFTE